MASKEILDVENTKKMFADVANEREWGQFHSPKNISMALSVEAAELMEIFQWMDSDDSRKLDEKTIQRVREEVADVFLYTIRLADLLKINLSEAVNEKMEQNAQKYPVEKSRGNSKKYTDLD